MLPKAIPSRSFSDDASNSEDRSPSPIGSTTSANSTRFTRIEL